MISEPTNIIHTEEITTSYSTLINIQTTYQLSSSKYHRLSAEKYLIYLVIKNTSIKLHPHKITQLKSVASMKIFNSRQHSRQEGTVLEKLYGLIHHIVSMWKPTSVEYFYVSWGSTSRDFINTASYWIEIISRSAAVAR